MLLLQELLDLDVVDRDELMQEFEKGCDYVIYLVEVEFSVWHRLPLRICALGHPNASRAKEVLRLCQEMFAALEPEVQAEMHTLVWSMFDFRGWLSEQLIAFLDSNVPLRDLPDLRRVSYKLRLVRCNEVSVERLHAVATREGTRATCISPAAVSNTLREPCMWHPTWGFAMYEMAEEGAKVCNDKLRVSTFNFERHPAVTTYRDRILARPKKTTATSDATGRTGR